MVARASTFTVPVRSERPDGVTDAWTAVELEIRALEPILRAVAAPGEQVSRSMIVSGSGTVSGALYLRSGNRAGVTAAFTWTAGKPKQIVIRVAVLSRVQGSLQILALVLGIALGFTIVRVVDPTMAPLLQFCVAGLTGVAFGVGLLLVLVRTQLGGSPASYAILERAAPAVVAWLDTDRPVPRPLPVVRTL